MHFPSIQSTWPTTSSQQMNHSSHSLQYQSENEMNQWPQPIKQQRGIGTSPAMPLSTSLLEETPEPLIRSHTVTPQHHQGPMMNSTTTTVGNDCGGVSWYGSVNCHDTPQRQHQHVPAWLLSSSRSTSSTEHSDGFIQGNVRIDPNFSTRKSFQQHVYNHHQQAEGTAPWHPMGAGQTVSQPSTFMTTDSSSARIDRQRRGGIALTIGLDQTSSTTQPPPLRETRTTMMRRRRQQQQQQQTQQQTQFNELQQHVNTSKTNHLTQRMRTTAAAAAGTAGSLQQKRSGFRAFMQQQKAQYKAKQQSQQEEPNTYEFEAMERQVQQSLSSTQQQQQEEPSWMKLGGIRAKNTQMDNPTNSQYTQQQQQGGNDSLFHSNQRQRVPFQRQPQHSEPFPTSSSSVRPMWDETRQDFGGVLSQRSVESLPPCGWRPSPFPSTTHRMSRSSSPALSQAHIDRSAEAMGYRTRGFSGANRMNTTMNTEGYSAPAPGQRWLSSAESFKQLLNNASSAFAGTRPTTTEPFVNQQRQSFRKPAAEAAIMESITEPVMAASVNWNQSLSRSTSHSSQISSRHPQQQSHYSFHRGRFTRPPRVQQRYQLNSSNIAIFLLLVCAGVSLLLESINKWLL